MTDEQIKEAIRAAMHGIEYDEPSITIVREDRHDRASKVLAVEFICSELNFEAVSELAGAFMTPNMTIAAETEDPNNDEPYAWLKVTLRSPGDIDQLIVDGDVEEITMPIEAT